MTTDDAGTEAPVGEEAAQPERSGSDVVAAVERASAGTPHGGVLGDPEDAKPGGAPVEQVRGDADMTGGQVVDGPGESAEAPAKPDPSEAGSGGAQAVVGARVPDRLSGGEQSPDGPPFEERDSE